MTWIDFVIRLIIAFVLGVGIGIERQWLKERSVLKTNVLVTLGAAMFVMLSAMVPGDASPTRIAAQVVSGIGFLGGGVILREGSSVRGINTAATLWCAGAIGSLVGSGFLFQAYFSTLAVVGANLLLRPVVQVFQPKLIDQNPRNGELAISDSRKNVEAINKDKNDNKDDAQLVIAFPPQIRYRCSFTCHPQDESTLLTALLEFVKNQDLSLTSIQSQKVTNDKLDIIYRVKLTLELVAEENKDELALLSSIASILKSKATDSPLNWEFVTEKLK
jgi:putative Mg2+ transporter-C (MgtC) family protein